MGFLNRLRWQARYAYLMLRSPYAVSPWGAWCEAAASWEMNDAERCGEPMPTPAEAIYEDQYEWSMR